MFDILRAAAAAEPAAATAVVATGVVATLQQVFGIEPGIATAGALGSFASLAFIRDLQSRVAMLSVLSGVGVSLYFTLPVHEYATAHWGASGTWKHAIALCLGLCGFHILAGIYQLARRWRADPVATVKDLRR